MTTHSDAVRVVAEAIRGHFLSQSSNYDRCVCDGWVEGDDWDDHLASVAVDTLDLVNNRLVDLVKDLALHGLRADLTPTMDHQSVEALYSGFADYLRRLDDQLRDRASGALAAVSS